MLRWLGVFMLFAASAAFGFYKAATLRFRYQRLMNICLFIESAAARIRVGEGMKSIIDSVGGKSGFYTKDYRLCVLPDSLNEAEIRLAEEFLNGLGMGDTETEIKRCETYKELFRKELQVAELQLREKGSLYGKLGIFFGLLMGIVFI